MDRGAVVARVTVDVLAVTFSRLIAVFGFVVAYDGSLGRRVERVHATTALSRGGPTYVGAMLNGNDMEVVGRNTLHAVHISAHRYRTEEVAHATRGRSPGKVSAYCRANSHPRPGGGLDVYVALVHARTSSCSTAIMRSDADAVASPPRNSQLLTHILGYSG